MRLEKIQDFLKTREDILYEYNEDDGLGSIDIQFRGIKYHIWEFEDGGACGVETNINNCSRSEDMTGDYETEIVKIMKKWPRMMTKG